MTETETFQVPAPKGQPGLEDARMGENIRYLRKRAGMSQGDLAAAMQAEGMSTWYQTTVSRTENGRQVLKMGEIRGLEQILGGGVLGGTSLEQTLQHLNRTIVNGTVRGQVAKAERALAELAEAVAFLKESFSDDEADDGEHQ